MNKIFKIIIPIVMVCIVIGIWFFKNTPSNDKVDELTVITEAIDLQKLKEANLPVMIEFSSKDCPACSLMNPILLEIKNETMGKLSFIYVDVSQNPEFARDFPVKVTPTRIFINADGSPFLPSEELEKEAQLIRYTYKDSGNHAFTAQEGAVSKEIILKVLKEMGIK